MTALTYSVDEAADLLGVGRRWLAEAARDQRVPSIKLGIRTRFTPAQIDEILRDHTRGVEALRPDPWGRTPAAVRRTRRR